MVSETNKDSHLSSVTNVKAPGMWGAVSHAVMHKHTVHTHTSRQTVSDAYKLHVLAYNQPYSDLGMIEMSCTRLNQFAGLVENWKTHNDKYYNSPT